MLGLREFTASTLLQGCLPLDFSLIGAVLLLDCQPFLAVYFSSPRSVILGGLQQLWQRSQSTAT